MALTRVVPSLLPIFKLHRHWVGLPAQVSLFGFYLEFELWQTFAPLRLGFIVDLKVHIHPFDPAFEAEIVVVMVRPERTGRNSQNEVGDSSGPLPASRD
ncbi:MAG TPA: hypothetical protein VI685_05130 [Candidatus Angelobacter sp.]